MSRITRNQVVELFGTPDHTTGSLNSPIELDDLGIHFNEKWTYDDLDADPAGVRMRTIYWHRYDFRGTRIRTSEAEEWHDDARLAEALAALPDRLEPITNDHNSPNTPRSYHPVSKPKDETDLGGYFQVFDDKE